MALFFVFSNTNCIEKTAGVSGIRTRIVGVEGEHADHLTTATAPRSDFLSTLSNRKSTFNLNRTKAIK